MPRIVVTTISGEPIRSLWVPDADLERQAGTLIEALPDLPLYIEGEEITPELRASLLTQAAQLREATRMAGDLTPEKIRETNDALVHCCEELTRVQLDRAREFALLVRTQNETVLEDGVRARFMLHQCVEDITAGELGTPARVKANITRPYAGTETPVIEGNAWTRAKQRWQARGEGYKKD